MSQNNAVSAKKTTILSAVASFAGMMAAIPVSLAIFSAAPQAQAMQQPQNDSYAQYAKAYTQGYLASTDESAPVNCQDSQPAEETEMAAPQATTTSYTKQQMPPKHHNKMMSPKELEQTINNSYNTYVSNVHNETKVHTKNINSNNTIGSNNTSNSSVTVKDSNGAVVSSNTTATGNNLSNTSVSNVASNNTAVVNDSFNQDSHDKKIVVKDSGNTTTTTTNNTSIINDSFNKKTDVDVNVNSNNKFEDNSHTYIKHDELNL